MRYALTVGITLALMGCASTNTWTRGPEADPNLSLEQQRAQCSARTFGDGKDDGERATQDFDICMRASGWLRTDRKCRTASDSRLWLPTCE
jgi:hypothetical protein